MSGLDFEKPIIELEAKINDLKKMGRAKKIDFEPEIKKIDQKIEKMKNEIYSKSAIYAGLYSFDDFRIH